MHQINARAKRETLVEKKGTTKKKTSEMETERERGKTNIHKTRKNKGKFLSFSFILLYITKCFNSICFGIKSILC
jgi:hypothetical protein